MHCKICNGNDSDAPCAYTTERPDGCLRERRMVLQRLYNVVLELMRTGELRYSKQVSEKLYPVLEDANRVLAPYQPTIG